MWRASAPPDGEQKSRAIRLASRASILLKWRKLQGTPIRPLFGDQPRPERLSTLSVSMANNWKGDAALDLIISRSG